MKSSGFSFIEVIVALLMSSLISVMIYQVFARTTRVAGLMNSRIDEYGDTLVAAAQLERDLMGIVLFADSEAATGETNKTASEQKASDDAIINALEKETGELERLERIPFSCVVREGKLISLSFVTTNALPSVDVVSSRLVWVRYFLAPNRDDPTLAQLMREEVSYGGARCSMEERRSYPLLLRLESMEFTFYSKIVKREGEPDGEQELALAEWGTEEQKKKLPVAAPEYVAISGVYRALRSDERISFSLLVAIPAAHLALYDYYEKEKKQQKKIAGAP